MAENNNPIKYSDLIVDDGALQKAIAQLEQLGATYDKLAKDIKSQAIVINTSIKSASGATEEGRKATAKASTEVDKLVKAQQALAEAQSDNAQRLAELKLALADQTAMNKANAKEANAQIGSYNQLSAQYTKLKLVLNNMSEEQRKNTQVGQEMEKEARAIYERMNELQKATGKYTLQVGKYTIAGNSTKQMLKQMKDALLDMESAGQKGSQAYIELSEKAGALQDSIDDTNASIKALASDTSTLDAVMSGASLGTGGFAVATGALDLLGASSDGVEEAQRKLQSAIALCNGMTQIQNALQKQSALMIGISRIQTLALAKAEAIETATKNAGTKATKSATIAMKAFNLVAKANPYVLLATALLTVGGAITAIAVGSNRQAKAEKKLYDLQLKRLELSEMVKDNMNQVMKSQNVATNQELALAEAQGASKREILQLQEKELSERSHIAYASSQFNKAEIDNLEKNKTLLNELQQTQQKAEMGKKNGIKLNDKEKEALEAHIALVQRQIEIGEEQLAQNRELEVQLATLTEQRKQLELEEAKTEEDTFRSLQDAKVNLVKNSFERQRIQTKAQYTRQIADLQHQLDTDKNLTIKARENITNQMLALKRVEAMQLNLINEQEKQANIEAIRQTEDMRLALEGDSQAKRRLQLEASYAREKADLANKLATDRDLTTTQREELNKQLLLIDEQYAKDKTELDATIAIEGYNQQLKANKLKQEAIIDSNADTLELQLEALDLERQIAIAENAKLTEDMRQSEADINAKYNAQALKLASDYTQARSLAMFDKEKALAESEIDLLKTTENRKTALRLELENKRWEKILELNEQSAVKMSDVEVETIKNTIKKNQQLIDQSRRPEDLYDVLGLHVTDDQKDGLNQALDSAKSAIQDYLDQRVKVAERAVKSADDEVEATQNALNLERQARANGYANNVEMAEKELQNAKRNQQKALKQEAEAQRQQKAIDSLQQASSLVTASAKIIKDFGMPWCIPMIALMWGTFATAKIKANQVSKETYGEGTVQLLEGGSHQSGDDIDLGTKKDGTKRRAEGGEFFAVINKRNSRKYRKDIPEVIKSFNDGSFGRKFIRANSDNAVVYNVTTYNPSMAKIEKAVDEINQRNARQITYDAQGNKIIRYKNTTTTIRR